MYLKRALNMFESRFTKVYRINLFGKFGGGRFPQGNLNKLQLSHSPNYHKFWLIKSKWLMFGCILHSQNKSTSPCGLMFNEAETKCRRVIKKKKKSTASPSFKLVLHPLCFLPNISSSGSGYQVSPQSTEGLSFPLSLYQKVSSLRTIILSVLVTPGLVHLRAAWFLFVDRICILAWLLSCQ